jgi:hypothetical protein
VSAPLAAERFDAGGRELDIRHNMTHTPAPANLDAACPARRGAVELLLLAAFTACLLGWLSAAAYAACLGLHVL